MYTNLDGITAAPQSADYIAHLMTRGYTQCVQLRGIVGSSELGMFTRKSERTGIVAFTRADNAPAPDGRMSGYAYALLDDGTILDGCFNRWADGRFSLS